MTRRISAPKGARRDLRPQIRDLGIPIRNQGGRGTCSVHAITFVLEYVYTRHKNLAYRNLSEEYGYVSFNYIRKYANDLIGYD